MVVPSVREKFTGVMVSGLKSMAMVSACGCSG
jgi:hypothetical protein